MIYLDTSFLASLVLQEAHTVKAIHDFEKISDERLVTSLWTKVEFSSLMARRVRMRELNQPLVIEAKSFFDRIIMALEKAVPIVHDYELASKLIENPRQKGLRAADAFHLAVAMRYQTKHFYTFDKELAKIAKSLGQKVNHF